MSSWLKATQRRVKETILQSVGAHDKTFDQEFDDRCAKFVLFYRDLTKVHMSMQLWLDSVDLLCGSWIGLGESLTKFCSTNDNDSSLYDLTKGFSSIGNDVNIVLRGIMKTIFIDRCLKPIESILAIVPIINQKIQERKNILLDVAFYNSKKQSEKSSGKDDNHPNVIKIVNKLNESERILKNLTDDIESCIDQLCSARPFMLGPEVASLIACMETFPLIISQKVGQMTPLIPQTASTKCLLLASIENAEINLKSNGIVETLKSNSSLFPIEPVLRRTGAMGGTTGGYGNAGYLEGLMSTVDLLLKSGDPSSRNSGNLDHDFSRDSTSISRDSQNIRISSSGQSSSSSSSPSMSMSANTTTNSTSLSSDIGQMRSSSPSPNTINNPPSRALTAGKRQVIKLGSDRPLSTKLTQPIDLTNTSTSSTSLSTTSTTSSSPSSSNEASHVTRPLSILKPSYPPPKPPKDDSTTLLNGDNNNNNNNQNNQNHMSRRIPSKRLTGSALLMSGRPRDTLGISSTTSPSPTLNESESLEEVSEEGIEYDRWKENNYIDESNPIAIIPQSIRVSQFSIHSGDISLDVLKKPTSPLSSSFSSETSTNLSSSNHQISSESNSTNHKSTNLTQVSPPSLPPPPPSSILKESKDEFVVAIYKYDSDVEGDLTFKRDDVIQVISKDDPGWWTGKISDRIGIFPSNYVKSIE